MQFDLSGEYSNCKLLSGLFLTSNDHQELKTKFNHLVPNCKSHQNIRNVLESKSKGIYQGKIFVKNKNTNYTIIIGKGLLGILKKQLNKLCPRTKKVGLILDKNIPNHFKIKIKKQLKKYNVYVYEFLPNERLKSFKKANFSSISVPVDAEDPAERAAGPSARALPPFLAPKTVPSPWPPRGESPSTFDSRCPAKHNAGPVVAALPIIVSLRPRPARRG